MSPRRRIAGEQRRRPDTDVAEGASSSDVSSSAADGTHEGAPTEAPPARTKARRQREPLSRRARVLLAVLAATTILALAFAATTAYAVRSAESAATDRVDLEETATSAASDALESVLSYSHESVESDLDEAQDLMTEDFAAEYAQLAPQVTSLAEQRKLVVTSTVEAIAPIACGQDCSSSEVRVLAFVDQNRTIDGEAGSPAALSAVVRMEKVDGEWLLAEMTTS